MRCQMKIVHCLFTKLFIVNYLFFAACFLVSRQNRVSWLDSSLMFNIVSLILLCCYLVFFAARKCRSKLEKGFVVELAGIVAALLLTLSLALITLVLISDLSTVV